MEIIVDKTACFTGHRPDNLYGFDRNSEGNKRIRRKIHDMISHVVEFHGIDTFISGMALGVDMWAALSVLKLKKQYPNLRLVAAIPCQRQWQKWRPEDVELWKYIVDRCDLVHMVTNGPYTPSCMQIRNMWMVDNSQLVIAVYNGAKTGGTYNCIRYAQRKRKTIYYIDPLRC